MRAVEWGYRYSVLMERYSGTVRGQFFGHTHYDNFAVQRDFMDRPVGVTFVHPSLTTYVPVPIPP